jgi:hypothetical protein
MFFVYYICNYATNVGHNVLFLHDVLNVVAGEQELLNMFGKDVV